MTKSEPKPDSNYLKHEFELLHKLQFGKFSDNPTPQFTAFLKRFFYAGAQSVFIGLHQTSGLPETEFIEALSEELAKFVKHAKEGKMI